MPRKKAANATQSRVETLDKLLAQIDPEIVLAGALGAVATAGGITPPLTRLLMAVGGNVDLGSDIANKAGQTWYDVAQWGSPILFALGLSFGESGGSQDKSVKATTQAVVAAGAMEAMMMMAFMKNPNAMQALTSLIPAKAL